MSFLDHVTRVNRHDLSGFRRFLIGDAHAGYLRHAMAERLKAQADTFMVDAETVRLLPALSDPEARTEAVDRAVRQLVAEGAVAKIRFEQYPVLERPGGPILMRINRAAAAHFGIISFGVHLNGYVRRPDGIHLWIGRRARDKSVAPGKLDNMVAGGMGDGYGPVETLVKECGEEAGLPEALAARAQPVGAITYMMEVGSDTAHGAAADIGQDGLRRDVLYCFDLELPADFTPVCQDGEIEEFRLLPIAEVARIVDTSDAFKFNCNLVIIDFLIRHGLIGPDRPDYLDLVSGLHR
jgi:8-oxo-dGTP pyrophosphatase MutT (NUDIX family)